MTGMILFGLVCAWRAAAIGPGTDSRPKLALRDGDVVAFCGDSITSQGYYPFFVEMYQHACGPQMKVAFVNCGRWGKRAVDFPKDWEVDFIPARPTVVTICYGMNTGRGGQVIDANTVAAEGAALQAIVGKFREIGGRVAILGSPGCVDSTWHKAPAVANVNLAKLRDGARQAAAETQSVFADVHTPMMEVMARAKEKYGPEYPFAGGKGDGVHPGRAGHLVMAGVFLQALGFDGDIGAITVDLEKNQAAASGDHRVLSCKAGAVEIESARYPFCFADDGARPPNTTNANATLSVAGLFSFHEALNRYMLVAKGAKAKRLTVTWGAQSKTFDATALEKGINLAGEFTSNPFCGPFGKVFEAIMERNRCRKWLTEPAYLNSPGMSNRLARAIENTKVLPVKHTLKIEPLP